MCILQIFVQCHDRFFEVLREEVESTEVIVEDAISQVLLDLFGEVSVDDVAIRFSSDLRMGLQHCSIQIQAQCSYQSFALSPREAGLTNGDESSTERRHRPACRGNLRLRG